MKTAFQNKPEKKKILPVFNKTFPILPQLKIYFEQCKCLPSQLMSHLRESASGEKYSSVFPKTLLFIRFRSEFLDSGGKKNSQK